MCRAVCTVIYNFAKKDTPFCTDSISVHNCGNRDSQSRLKLFDPIQKYYHQGMSPFHMAVSTGQSNIARFLVLNKINADHKTSSGMGCLQLAQGSGGKLQESYNWLLKNAYDISGEKLVLTTVASGNTNKHRGSVQNTYRRTNCVKGKGSNHVR